MKKPTAPPWKEIGIERTPDLKAAIKRHLGKGPMSAAELAEALDRKPSQIRAVIAELRRAGTNISIIHGDRHLLNPVLEQGGRLELRPKDRGDGWTVFGFITDNHKGSKHHRQDVEDAAYATFKREGVTTVLNAGNPIDGECRFNKHELLIHGMDAQIDYWAETTPQVPGITTHFITGDDHEGWYAQRECINIGQYMQMKAERAGRKDLKYIGHVEADIAFKGKGGEAVGRIMHPGGGSAYALSYAPQKIVEAFQGGEKPDVLFIGHYHKMDYCYPREVHVISGGCAQDQTMFMRKKKLAAHVGFHLIGLQQDKQDGHITRLRVEWVSFYDRGYYERRFG